MDIIIKGGQLLLSLSILIILHELGHFIPARLFKIRVEKFYLFFDPWFSLVKKKVGDTVYGIGWLPLGGYVKIAGMIDESMDKEQMKKPPQPWEFRSKPAWQRLIVMVGGVTVNVIVAFIIYAMVLFTYGQDILPNDAVKDGIAITEEAERAGFENGDKIISVDGKVYDDFSRLPMEILFANNAVQVERGGEVIDVKIDDNDIKELIATGGLFMTVRVPFDIDTVVKGFPAEKAGLLKGDRIVAVNDIATPFSDQVSKEVRKHKGETISVTVLRDNLEKTLAVSVLDTGKHAGGIGISKNRRLRDYVEIEHVSYSFGASIPAGVSLTFDKLNDYVRQFKIILNRKTGAYKQVGGFAAIANAFPSEWIWEDFWRFTAFLSVMLAFLNILPIPALDGGHVMFVLYEMISGRKPPEKFMEVAQIIGFFLLMALILLANGNDILKAFSN